MTEELKLTAEYKGYTISWVSYRKEWYVELEGQHAKRGFASPDKAQEWIDAQLKRQYKRVDVLIRSGYMASERFVRATATSIDVEWKRAWVSEPDGKRSKHEIGDIYLDTPENQGIIARIAALNENIAMLEKEQGKEMAQLTKLTPEMMVEHD